MGFFEVTAKCGHVGRGQFYMGMFYVRAENGSEAAALVRQKPRVKHHHKDAILSVVNICYDEYIAGREVYKTNPYFNCKNRQEQRIHEGELSVDIYAETNFGKRERRDDSDRLARLKAERRFLRKMDKHGYIIYDLGA